uniref:Prohibitin n=1 Tax=Oryctolagus cuniculus TaxID=9986 RepID=A0A5F9CIB1_RABIT
MAAKVFESIGKSGLAISVAEDVGNFASWNVDAGHRAVISDQFCGVQDMVVGRRNSFPHPVGAEINYLCRSCPWNVWATTGSKQLQNVDFTLRSLFWQVASQLPTVFSSSRERYDKLVLLSITLELLKSAMAHFDAGKLITQRERVSRQVRDDLTERVATFGLILDGVSLTHLTFGREFTEAVEAKPVAWQEAERARFVVKAEQHKAQRLHNVYLFLPLNCNSIAKPESSTLEYFKGGPAMMGLSPSIYLEPRLVCDTELTTS